MEAYIEVLMRCDQCRHWSRDDEERKLAGAFFVRRCTKAKQWWGVTEWTEEEDPECEWDNNRRLLPEYASLKMFTQDGSDYRADLLTAADFFCAHFEQC